MWDRFTERWQLLTREQQISVVILAICGGCAITLSLFRIQASIQEPFLVRKDTLLNAKKLIGLTEQQKLERDQRIDTDGDSLSDWDEVNTYKTNPNLRDSCGDGIPDNVRVATGKNLACAGISGSSQIDTSGLKADSTLSPVDIAVPGGAAGNAAAAVKTPLPSTSDPQAFLQQMLPRDPKLIREMLKGKVDAARLQQISDEDLLKLFDAALQDEPPVIDQINATTTSSTTDANAQITP